MELSISSFIKPIFFAFLIGCVFNAKAIDHALYYVPNADNEEVEGFIRVTNADTVDAFISIRGIDDEGNIGNTSLSFELSPLQTLHLNSGDIENGNRGKGLSGALGDGVGDWRLFIDSSNELHVMSYIRTPDGFLNDMHDVAELSPSKTDVLVPIFNPSSNLNQVSRLRISNDSKFTCFVMILAIDDSGIAAAEPVSIVIPPYQVAEISAQELENGMDRFSSHGKAGDGTGKWKLLVSSTNSITVMNLLQAGSYVSNLSGLSYDINQFDALNWNNFYATSTVDGNFNGWVGNNVYNFTDGSQWQQAEPFIGSQQVSDSPNSVYLKMKNDWFVWVDGTDQLVKVNRLF
jgi:hypothetical protein